MTFHQFRISVIPVLLLSTAAGIVVWQVRTGVDRRRAARMTELMQAHTMGQLNEPAVRRKLRASVTERDLWRWVTFPTRPVRDSALRGLGLIGTTRSVELLGRLLRDDNPHTRLLAESALRQARRRSGQPVADALLQRVDELLAAELADQALAALTRCQTLLPDHAEVHFRTGAVLLDLDRPQDAEEAFTLALEADPSHFDALLGRALSRLVQGDSVHAYADCLRALEINPNMGEIRLLLGGP